MKIAEVIRIISILSILIPILIGTLKYKTAGSEIRLFFLFLLSGFLTDAAMYYFLETGKLNYLPIIFNTYSLIESIFFYYMILQCISLKSLKSIVKVLIFTTPVFWIITISALSLFKATPARLFDTVYEVTAATLSGYTLLKMVEKNESIFSLPEFWILSGIFFYCFCTFFIMSFLDTILSQQIWFLNNVINIITYIFYSVGLWCVKPQKIID